MWESSDCGPRGIDSLSLEKIHTVQAVEGRAGMTQNHLDGKSSRRDDRSHSAWLRPETAYQHVIRSLERRMKNLIRETLGRFYSTLGTFIPNTSHKLPKDNKPIESVPFPGAYAGRLRIKLAVAPVQAVGMRPRNFHRGHKWLLHLDVVTCVT